MSRPSWQHASHILCVRLDTVGDVLMCTPAMRAIKQSRPGRQVSLLTSRGGAAAAPYLPEVDAVLQYCAPWVGSSAAHAPFIDAAMVQSLTAAQFDAAVIFSARHQSALPAAMLCYLAGIPLRLAHCRENPHHLLTHWVEDHEPGKLMRHDVQRQLDLVGSVGFEAESASLSFAVPEEDLSRVERHLASLGIGQHQRLVIMHPGANTRAPCFPAALWADVICGLWQRGGYAIVLAGEVQERPLIDEIRTLCRAPFHSLAGLLHPGQLGAAMRLASVVVCANASAAHMAMAVGTPQVNLHALAHPQRPLSPLAIRLQLPEARCNNCCQSTCAPGQCACTGALSPNQVIDAICSFAERKISA